MPLSRLTLPRDAAGWARLLALAAAVSILFSIAVKEILLGAAIAALLLSRRKWRMPAGWLLPLALFAGGTVAALWLSPDWRAGLPQIKKFYAYLIIPVLLTALRGAADAALTMRLCLAAGVLSSLWSFVQFGRKWLAASRTGQDFYLHYIAQRTTGFMSHWQTFGGQLGILLVVAVALLLFARGERRAQRQAGLALAILLAATALNLTRGIYIASAVALVYLLWAWRPKALLVLPLIGLAALAVAPVRRRAMSLVAPRGEVDSNQHRLVTWRTGLAMIQAHPLTGVGPDRVDEEFQTYLPQDVKHLPEGWYGHLHNTYLQYAADRGIPVLLCLLWLLGRMLLDLLRGVRRSTEPWLVRAGIAAWIGVMVSGLFEANLANSEVLHLFLVTMVCAYAATPQVVPPS